jgi:uncharacterized membrane protein
VQKCICIEIDVFYYTFVSEGFARYGQRRILTTTEMEAYKNQKVRWSILKQSEFPSGLFNLRGIIFLCSNDIGISILIFVWIKKKCIVCAILYFSIVNFFINLFI